MIIDLRHAPDAGPQWAETLVVGSGAVGLTMAVELSRAGRQVIVLEAGGQGVNADSQAFFKAACWRDRPLPGLHLGRFRALGGATNFWGGQLLPLDPIVFGPRPWVADVAWPITREELTPYYERGYELLGMSRHLADDAVWRRVNVTPPPLGDAIESFFSAWAPEPNLPILFGGEIAASPNACVFVDAPAVALDLDPAGERVTGVLVRTAAGAVRRFSGQRIILANGTVEIARLLKMMLADGRRAPWSGNPRLGKGFADHIDCLAGYVTPLDKRRFHDLFDNVYLDGIKYAPKLKLSARAQRERQLLGVAVSFLFNSSVDEHLANAKLLANALLKGQFKRQLVPSPRECLSILRVATPMVVRYLRNRRMYNPSDKGVQFRLMSEQFPLHESAIHLAEKRDALGMPIVEMDWRIDGREVETLATVAELVTHYLERHQLASVRLDPALVARDRSLLARCDDFYHHMGMARMGTTPDEGVVDRDLKVFGMRNLYVAGAAVFPTTGFANPTFTAIALGLRLASAIGAERASA